ncbi:mechanosensitive ion channel family protein [Pleionea sp. CnH1-48]|uniref:mechanosensitive ion channel family protein n=1 Tax=Pleionea sp. CnH1-48 TaxID=2954494 RepID=UPI0035310E69
MYVIPYGIKVIMAILIFVIGKMVVKAITKVLIKVMKKAKTDDILIDFISGIIGSLLMLFVIIAAIGQLGVDTTSLVALIGAAGLAIGLSLQSSLQNFASGVMLIVFRPFTSGDFVEVAGIAGIVEKITIFSTQLRTPDNKEMIVPNGKIYGDVITNYSAKPTRRVDMVFGIGYGDDIKKAKEVLESILEEDERILKDPAYVVAVSELADSSVNFVVRPWVNAADYWNVFFDTHEKVKLRFDAENISIPFPQMDIHLDKVES